MSRLGLPAFNIGENEEAEWFYSIPSQTKLLLWRVSSAAMAASPVALIFCGVVNALSWLPGTKYSTPPTCPHSIVVPCSSNNHASLGLHITQRPSTCSLRDSRMDHFHTPHIAQMYHRYQIYTLLAMIEKHSRWMGTRYELKIVIDIYVEDEGT